MLSAIRVAAAGSRQAPGYLYSAQVLWAVLHSHQKVITMTHEQQQALADLPIWGVIAVAVAAGFSGEMWRADRDGLRGRELVYRVILRAGASVVFGLSTMLLVWASGAHVLVAAAIGFVVATMGADVASGLYERWLAKRAGVCEVPAKPDSDGAA